MDKKNNSIIAFLEGLTTLMIILVLIQTFLEDFSILIGGSYQAVHMIKLSAFIFDLYFTIEFFSRLLSAMKKKEASIYFLKRSGWIDFLASIPLLLLVSGPYLLVSVMDLETAGITSLTTFSMIKLIKAVRVARILRLLRVLKIFGTIKNTDSKMAQRHVNYILTMIILIVISYSFASNLLQSLNFTDSPSSEVLKEYQRTTETIGLLFEKNDTVDATIKSITADYPEILSIQLKQKEIYKTNKYTDYELHYIVKHDTDIISAITPKSNPDVTFNYYSHSFRVFESTNTVYNFVLIILLVLAILLIYTRHFALTISDPIFVMRNGFEKLNYTLAVKIPDSYSEDDIFKLSDDFNKKWLPAKVRKLEEKNNVTSKLSLDDVFGKK